MPLPAEARQTHRHFSISNKQAISSGSFSFASRRFSETTALRSCTKRQVFSTHGKTRRDIPRRCSVHCITSCACRRRRADANCLPRFGESREAFWIAVVLWRSGAETRFDWIPPPRLRAGSSGRSWRDKVGGSSSPGSSCCRVVAARPASGRRASSSSRRCCSAATGMPMC